MEECAFLAGINNSPNSYNPFTDKDNTEKIKKRTKTVLNKMLELNYITENEYHNSINEIEKGLDFKKGEIPSENAIYSYHTDALITQIIDDISEEYKISETFSTNYINMAGLKIYSTQNSEIQKQMETEFKKNKYILKSNRGGETSQAAMVIIDHETGNVLGCTGGLGEKKVSRSLNRATQSVRQTGSAIKPLSVLVPGIDKKIITGASILDDTEKDFEGNYHPTDYSSPLGKITVRRALESSQNIPFVEIMEKIKPENSIKYLKKMGITTLTKEDNSLVLALGGLQKGISPLEMAGAYATIANDGTYIEPTFYTKIYENTGEILLEVKQKSKKVFSEEVAYILKNLLTQPVIGNYGTATYCAINGMDIAAKTGTTDENYDRWLCGFSPYYTAVTWYGYDENEPVLYDNKNPAGLIWSSVMTKIHTNLKNAKFEKPQNVYSTKICAETGKKANEGCSNSYTEYFLWLTIPDECTAHSVKSLNNTFKEKQNNTTIETNNSVDKTNVYNVKNDEKLNTENTNINTQINTNKTTNNSSGNTTNKNNTEINNSINETKDNSVEKNNNVSNILNESTNSNLSNNVNNTAVKQNSVSNSNDNVILSNNTINKSSK